MTRTEAIAFAKEIAKEKKNEMKNERRMTKEEIGKRLIEVRGECLKKAIAELYGGGSRYAERLED